MSLFSQTGSPSRGCSLAMPPWGFLSLTSWKTCALTSTFHSSPLSNFSAFLGGSKWPRHFSTLSEMTMKTLTATTSLTEICRYTKEWQSLKTAIVFHEYANCGTHPYLIINLQEGASPQECLGQYKSPGIHSARRLQSLLLWRVLDDNKIC